MVSIFTSLIASTLLVVSITQCMQPAASEPSGLGGWTGSSSSGWSSSPKGAFGGASASGVGPRMMSESMILSKNEANLKRENKQNSNGEGQKELMATGWTEHN